MLTSREMRGILLKVLYKQVFWMRHADCISTSDKVCRLNCAFFFIAKKRTTWMCGTIKQIKGGKINNAYN